MRLPFITVCTSVIRFKRMECRQELETIITDAGISLANFREPIPSGIRLTGTIVGDALEAVYAKIIHPTQLQKETLASILYTSVDKIAYWFSNIRSKRNRIRNIQQIVISHSKSTGRTEASEVALAALGKNKCNRATLADEVERVFAVAPARKKPKSQAPDESANAVSRALRDKSQLMYVGMVSSEAIRANLVRVAIDVQSLVKDM